VNADKRRRGDGTGALSGDGRTGLARLRKENAELAMERAVLTQCRPLGQGRDGAVAVAALIAAQRDQHQIPHTTACRALGVSRSWFWFWFWFCKHKDRELPPGEARRQALAAEVRRLFTAHRGTYGPRGSPSAWARLGGRSGQREHRRGDHGRAGPGRPAQKEPPARHRPGKGRWLVPALVKRDFPAQKINTGRPRSASGRRPGWTMPGPRPPDTGQDARCLSCRKRLGQHGPDGCSDDAGSSPAELFTAGPLAPKPLAGMVAASVRFGEIWPNGLRFHPARSLVPGQVV
jgi:hypothetical protein